MMATIATCGACSVLYPSVEAGPTFRVKVENRGRPVQALRLEIRSYQTSDNRSISATDKDGRTLH